VEIEGEFRQLGWEKLGELAIETWFGKKNSSRLLQTAGTADKVLPPDVTDSGTLNGADSDERKKTSTGLDASGCPRLRCLARLGNK
jgi:hypothetical protein